MQINKINKIIKIIGVILILISSLFIFKLIYDCNYEKQRTEKIIKEEFIDKKPIIEEKIENKNNEDKENKEEVKLNNNYQGYIEFSGIRKLIVYGTDNKTLNKGYVGIHKVSAELDSECGNIILAGHNNYNTFKKLHYIDYGSEIKITTHKKTYVYEVVEKHVINPDNFSLFKKVNDEKILTLITCTDNGKQRLFVIAKLKGE